MSAERDKNFELQGVPTLLAIIRAARALGDRDLERTAKAILRDEHGIEVTFRRSARRWQVRNHATPPDSATRTLQAAAAVPDPLGAAGWSASSAARAPRV